MISLETYHYNVDDFVAAFEIIWATLKNSGGSDENSAQKIYEVLSRSKSEEFNTQLCAWKAAQENTMLDGSKDLLKVLQKANPFIWV